jgi:alpha/beta superfamily hydrolase
MPDARTLRIAVPETAITLEARLAEASTQAALAVIAPPHPLYGGSIGNLVVRALETALQARGFATLAFNFRGTGESSGAQRGDMGEALQDFLAAARALPAPPLRVLAGYSFGSAVALRAASLLSVSALLLVAPPLSLLDVTCVRGFSGTLRAVIGDDDEYGPHVELAELFLAAPAATLDVLEGVDHFFSGTQLARLSAVLPRLID